MLQEFVHAYVPDLHCAVRAGRSNTSATRVKRHVIHVTATPNTTCMHQTPDTTCMHQTPNTTDAPLSSRRLDPPISYPPCSMNVWTHSLLCRSHTLTVLSSLPDTISRPSGENLSHTNEQTNMQSNKQSNMKSNIY